MGIALLHSRSLKSAGLNFDRVLERRSMPPLPRGRALTDLCKHSGALDETNLVAQAEAGVEPLYHSPRCYIPSWYLVPRSKRQQESLGYVSREWQFDGLGACGMRLDMIYCAAHAVIEAIIVRDHASPPLPCAHRFFFTIREV